MKNTFIKILSAILLSGLFAVGCSSKTSPRATHEKAKTWTPQQVDEAPSDLQVFVNDFNTDSISNAFTNQDDLIERVLNPLSKVILDSNYFENPGNRSNKLLDLTRLFSEALYKVNQNSPAEPRVKAINEAYQNMIFSGCSANLRSDDCVNVNFIRGDRFVSKNLLQYAVANDLELQTLLESSKPSEECFKKSPRCGELLTQRYRYLAMAFLLKKNVNPDPDLVFAHLRFARPLAAWLKYSNIEIGYLKEVLGQSFENMISQYKPKDLNDPGFRAFVSNFNPWYYSGRKADEFRYGTRMMFEMASRCCFYQDSQKTQASQAVIDAIAQIQMNEGGDEFGPSFYQIVLDLKKHGWEGFFKSSGLESEWADISNLKSDFYKDDMFYIVDRLFRGHIEASDAMMLIKGSNFSRANERLNNVINVFVRVYLAHMILETNKFMADMYTTMSGSEIFREAIRNSRLITSRWHDIQSRFDLINKFAGGYFKGKGPLTEEYKATDRLVQSVNRNIHYLSVYPNMIVLTYYLVKLDGKVEYYTFWGQKKEIDANTILDSFFGGRMTDAWFSFGVDGVEMDRTMMLFAFNYAITSKALESFVDKDQADQGKSNRAKFFSTIVSRYLDGVERNLTESIASYQKSFEGRYDYSSALRVCDYELGLAQENVSPQTNINFLALSKYTYSGFGEQGVNGVVGAKLSAAITGFERISSIEEGRATSALNYKVPYVKAMLELIENDLLNSGQIKRRSDPHPELDTARAILASIDAKKSRFVQMFTEKHDYWNQCLVRLQSVERMRQNRIIAEERSYLSEVFKIIQTSDTTTSANEKFKAYYQAAFGASPRFDSIEGETFRYSQYDLFMRMKYRIESDIFSKPTEEEKQVYKDRVRELTKPRRVSVIVPPGLDRESIVETGSSTYINIKTSEPEFTKQAMLTLSGTGSFTFVDWAKAGRDDKFLFDYLRNLLRLYLIDGPGVISPKQVTDAYLSAIENSLMDELDLQNAKALSIDGRKEIRFFEDLVMEKDSHRSIPLFRNLMKDSFALAGMALNGWSEVATSVEVAGKLNNLGVFVFKPEPLVADSLARSIGGGANAQFVRLFGLYKYLESQDQNPRMQAKVASLAKRAIYLQNEEVYYWDTSEGLFDPLTKDKLKVFLKDYLKKTGNLFKTSEAIEASEKVVNGRE